MDKCVSPERPFDQWHVYATAPNRADPAVPSQSQPHARRLRDVRTYLTKDGAGTICNRAKIAAKSVSTALWGVTTKPRGKWMRSSAAICLMLVGAMALTQVNTPWGQNAVSTLSSAMNVRFDIDESIGKLQFVKSALPEAMQVFWDAGTAFKMKTPVLGSVTHPYTKDQPWLEYSKVEGGVHAPASGEVRQVEDTGERQYAVRIEHEGGYESIYAYFTTVSVKVGDALKTGDLIGQSVVGADSTPHLYWEVRRHGTPIDPKSKIS